MEALAEIEPIGIRSIDYLHGSMKWKICICLAFIGLIAGPRPVFGQEEESAEVYLEEYTDQFQELFFEALKQKGIENYDKAINLFLECKQMDPENEAIDHELAKVYFLEKNYVPALEAAIHALEADPTNFWYLHTLVEVLRVQGRSVMEINQRIPYQNSDLKKNLALIYYKQRNYEEALKILKDMEKSSFREDLTSKIRDSIEQVKDNVAPENLKPVSASEDPLAAYKSTLKALLSEQDFEKLEEVASEAMELFPTQPYFYYMKGKALLQKNEPARAVGVLETSLDFLLDDTDLNNQIYSDLARAYKALGNLTKANMYLSKLKDGS